MAPCGWRCPHLTLPSPSSFTALPSWGFCYRSRPQQQMENSVREPVRPSNIQCAGVLCPMSLHWLPWNVLLAHGLVVCNLVILLDCSCCCVRGAWTLCIATIILTDIVERLLPLSHNPAHACMHAWAATQPHFLTNYQKNYPVKAGRRWGQRHPQGANLGSNGILKFLSKTDTMAATSPP